MNLEEKIKALAAVNAGVPTPQERKERPAWKCNGYMTPHGFRKGRMWFVCPACRWSHK
jgi:hypothetical protein